MPSIQLTEVTKTYPLDLSEAARTVRDVLLGRGTAVPRAGTKVAVDRVSLEVAAGERVGIVGRNGAGKSTLLHMIAAVGAPTSGIVRVEGRVTSILTLGVGLREDLSGRENIYLDGEVQGKTRAEVDRVIGEIIGFADLGEFIDRPIRTYSTGMKARLAFAMISHIEPEILLIDEALSVGDAAFSAKATRRIREICAKGKIVIVVSHGLSAIKEICNRCLWMDNGRIIMDGTPEAVTDAYAKSIHEKDEAEMREQFRAHITARSFLDGFALESLRIYQGDESYPRSTIRAEHGISIRITGSYPATPQDIELWLEIERLDGLMLHEDSLSTTDPALALGPEGRFDVEALIPAALAHGTYKIVVRLTRAGSLAAERSSIIEVISQTEPSGGRPALYYPYGFIVEDLR